MKNHADLRVYGNYYANWRVMLMSQSGNSKNLIDGETHIQMHYCFTYFVRNNWQFFDVYFRKTMG